MAISEADYVRLSKTVAHALRHEPWLYELELDEAGWVPLSQLLSALRAADEQWHQLVEADLHKMIQASSKRRYEIRNGHIRALYGHSVPGKLRRVPSCPPAILFHGTSPKSLPGIRREGLKPMKRQYVHLSTDEETAIEVGRRKARQPVVVRIRALEAHEAGVSFYEGNELVWLADAVPVRFIDF